MHDVYERRDVRVYLNDVDIVIKCRFFMSCWLHAATFRTYNIRKYHAPKKCYLLSHHWLLLLLLFQQQRALFSCSAHIIMHTQKTLTHCTRCSHHIYIYNIRNIRSNELKIDGEMCVWAFVGSVIAASFFFRQKRLRPFCIHIGIVRLCSFIFVFYFIVVVVGWLWS